MSPKITGYEHLLLANLQPAGQVIYKRCSMTDQSAPQTLRITPKRGGATSPDPFIELVAEVFRIHRRIRSLFTESAGSTGLTRLQNSVLATVIETHHRHTVAQLGRNLDYPRQVIQRTTNELIERGLLCMEDNPSDKRARFVAATPAGKELKSIADAWASQISGGLLSDLDDGLCEKITVDLQRLRQTIDHHTDRRASIERQ